MPLRFGAADAAKFAAADYAVGLVRNGMRLGLGTGSTTDFFIDLLAARVRESGLSVSAVATSGRTENRAMQAGLALSSLNELKSLDLTVDGTDEIDPEFQLIKGGGGALLREKIVAEAADEMIVIADHGKWVRTLGKFPLPVEIDTFAWQTTAARIGAALETFGHTGCQQTLRIVNGSPFVTDGGNYVIDAGLGAIESPALLAGQLKMIPGVVETGLFTGQCAMAVLGHPDGTVHVRSRVGQVPG